MTTTLTDRYVWAVTRHLPDDQRDDIAEELRATVADMVDATDEPPEAAERAALVELGDPRRLAASYRDGHRHLIGPAVYDEYLRVLRLALAWATPIMAAIGALGALADDDDGGAAAVIAAGVGGAIEAVVWVAVAVTLTFVVVDRSRSTTAAAETWDPDQLEELPDPDEARFSVGDAVASLAATAFTIGAMFVQRTRFPVTTEEGVHVPLLQPGLWDLWAWVLIVLLLASGAVVATALRAGRWTLPLAIGNAAVNATSLGVVAWLAIEDRLINPEVLVTLAERAGWDDVPSVNPALVIAVVAIVEVWDSVEALAAARRRVPRVRRSGARSPRSVP